MYSSHPPQTTISGKFGLNTGINQYINGANQLTGFGKPPARLIKNGSGLISHNSSCNNLQLQVKNMTIITQASTLQNTSRKEKYE